MEIIIIVIGKIQDKNLDNLIKKYLTKVNKFCKIKIITLKEKNFNNIKKTISEETNEVILKLKNLNDYQKIIFNINGNLVNSLDFANIIMKNQTYNLGKLVFIIGGSNGLDYDLISRYTNSQISFGKITYTHQIFQLLLLEQIYRSFKIIRNEKYHK